MSPDGSATSKRTSEAGERFTRMEEAQAWFHCSMCNHDETLHQCPERYGRVLL